MSNERIVKLNQELLSFIEKSPSAFQAVEQAADCLCQAGFLKQAENASWEKADPRGPVRGFVTRNGSSLIAYSIPAGRPLGGFRMVCAHTDSPAFKIKENPVWQEDFGCRKLNVEKYGGMIVHTWLDRPLSAAGRVVYEKAGGLRSENIDLQQPLFVIPSLAIHMTGTDQAPLKVQQHLQPLSSMGVDLYEQLAQWLGGIQKEAILGADLFLYNRQQGCLLGGENPLVCAPRLDDLQCVYAALKGFLEAGEQGDRIRILGLFDNEEVGSLSRQGASSDFLQTTLENIAELLDLSRDALRRMLADSFMLSADNAHAVHPNYPEKADPTNRPQINGGIVIKYHGGLKYTTDACTGAYVKQLCRRNRIPFQTYHNHSDLAGGSTLGNLVLGKVSVPAADIGAPQLAMHSAYETAGALDTGYLTDLLRYFYESGSRPETV